jgi:amino-acid N-acetyltransferase
LDLINHCSFAQEFFIDLLSSAATKRDAKAYITRLKTAPSETGEKNSQAKTSSTFENQPARPGVNLGTFFGHARAVQQSPKFTQSRREEDTGALDEHQVHHLAIVKLVEPENIDDAALQGIGLTLSQLCRLSMTPCVVLECGLPVRKLGRATWRQEMTVQADRLERAIHISSGVEARVLDNVYTMSDATKPPRVFPRKLLMAPIKSGQIPIILPLAYSDETQTMRHISAYQAILALAREFAGLNVRSMLDEDSASMRQRLEALQKQTSLDRLIILDPQGGIPHPAAAGSNHVFLNIEQEYHDVRKELLNHMEAVCPSPLNQSSRADEETFSPSMSGLLPMSPQASREQATLDVFTANQILSRTDDFTGVPPNFARHIQNLDLLKDVLSFIPPSSSAIVTTPLEAARSSKSSAQTTSISAVGTRPQKNPLIHNLLTDKPPHSASLPIGRLGRSNDAGTVSPVVATPTFVKRGMPLTIIPDPRTHPWTPHPYGEPRLKLTDPRIDLSRLVHLIDDSFNRKLDVEHYLQRVNDRIAGLIIAGKYEGGALFTWETPPEASPSDLPRLVPYLDKFAVLKRSQGAGGVADIVFNAMVRGCFPNGVCWRSRRDNPVNKWYFERARGTWKLPGTNWTMFWTTEGVETGVGERFKDYEAVCRAVEPSWADKKKMAD